MSQVPRRLKAILFWIFRWAYSRMLALMYDGAPRTIATTRDSILMESASSLAGRIRNQKVTSSEVVRSYVNRIREINEVLNCVVDERFEEALEEAKKADEIIRSGAKTTEELERENPFLGVPFTAPESVAVKGLSNTMGLWGRRGARADADAGVVAAMRAGGGIPLASTNVSEGCLTRETHNPVFGRTRNPYDANRSAGGPYGGEGCLIASSGSPLGVAPSVALPSAFNGVFGHKPSATFSRDAAFMSRCSADLLPALRLLSRNSEIQLKLDEPVDVKKLKFYFMDGDSGSTLTSPVSEEIKQALERVVHHFRTTHKAFVERINLKGLKKALGKAKITPEEVAIDKDDDGVNLRRELVKALFGKSHHTFVFLLTSLLEDKTLSAAGSDVAETTVDSSQLFTEFQELLGSDGVFLWPTQPTAAFRHNESPARGHDFGYADIFEELGLPTTYCPAGLDSEGLPVGLQVVAAMNQDRLALAVGREMDKVLGGWTPPPTHGNFTLKNAVFHNLFNEKFKTL